MSVLNSDIKYYLTGASADGGAQADPTASLGNYRSSTEITSGALDNVFDDISSAQAQDGATEYRCICVKNTNVTDTLRNVVAWLYSEVDPDGTQQFSLAVEAPATANPTDGNAQTIANESTAPSVNTTDEIGTGSGISDWNTGITKGAGLTFDQGAHSTDLAPGEQVFIWIKRVISAGAPARSGMSQSIRTEGDTL